MANIDAPSWGFITWVVTILFVLTYCDKVLGYSPTEFVRIIFGEAKDLATGNVTRGAINFLGIVILFTLSMLVLFSENALALFNIKEVVTNEPGEVKTWLGFAMFILIFLKSIVCVALVKQSP